jgi:predicted transcriptional regulator
VLSIDGNATGSWFPPAVAANLPVGLALVRPFVCVRVELPWIDVASASVLAEEPHGAPVVDCSGRLVGLLPAAAIERAFRNAPADSFASAADCTVSAASIEETESLGSAFTMMGMRRLRELTVIDDGGIVVGVLRDVDALRFVAHVARTGQRPSECAV